MTQRRLRRAIVGVVAAAVVSTASLPVAGAAFVVGASSTSGASNTCTVAAQTPVLASGVVSSSFTVSCSVLTTVSYTVELREWDSTTYQRLISTTSSAYIGKTATSYTFKTASSLSCTSTTPLYSGANTESSREELYTYVTLSFGGYAAKTEQTAIPAENSTASFPC